MRQRYNFFLFDQKKVAIFLCFNRKLSDEHSHQRCKFIILTDRLMIWRAGREDFSDTTYINVREAKGFVQGGALRKTSIRLPQASGALFVHKT
jgi:hypothetical protein